ncbi:2TM domain-containing protein [Fortiea sp. LEGE XX443]|uniref:2TM domain-containing protein n=1 Tax=Fortiea sp. LEGE XX443 TaxID=1828611 RepID=UPI00188219F4|nr:2TM domain-containing protein [Fortiea sp. LEGE XX443]MBE9005123.1 2TM domain-containing protein [Fortiea sp. LEGE XX443]
MAAFEPNSNRSYSQEDVQRILQLAITRQADDQDKEFSYELLLEIAGELDISPDSLQLAERDWRSQQSEIQQRQAFDAYRLSRFKKRLGNFAIVNTVLISINFIATTGHILLFPWSLYILLFWGLNIGLDFWNNFHAKGEEYEIAFQKWYRKHQLKQNMNTVLQTANTLVNKWFKTLQI